MRWINRAAVLVLSVLSGCAGAVHATPLIIAHPDNTSAKIEYFQEHPVGTGPWPTIVLLHGHQGPTGRIGGLAFENWGVLSRFAKAGYLAVSISLPGYGGSSGPEDFAGPFTQHAVQAVIAKLEADRQAIPSKILIEGISLGAVTGALVAAHDKTLAGLVLISGLYDLPSFFADPRSAGALEVKAVAVLQTGGSEEALRARSALPLASQIHASTLILNGAQDDRTDADQARRLAAAINASGGHAIVHIFPDFGHEIPVRARDAEINSFIDATLAH
jgi:dipeptidyl aminopeptidase/acylaminoacyl peptidase